VLVDARYEESALSLDAALLPSVSLSTSNVGVYFEVYGVAPEEQLRVSVSAASKSKSIARRLTNLLRITAASELDVSWSESVPSAPSDHLARFVALDLTGLSDGDYALALQIERPDGATAVASLDIRLERR
jgi:hypothetical protein